MSDEPWVGFRLDNLDDFKTDLSDISTEDLEAELARRRDENADAPQGITGSSTLDEARAFSRHRAFHGKGGPCPLCTHLDKRYHRPLNKGQASFLMWMVNVSQEGEWIDTTTRPPKILTTKSRDFTLLRHWGLIEAHANHDKSKSGSGLWRVTQKGRDWAQGKIAVSSHFWKFRSDPIVLDDSKMVYVTDVLPNFDLAALMAGGS